MTGHALARLSADEIAAARDLVAEAGLVTPATRFSYVMLREPDKLQVLAGGTDLPREVGMLLTDLDTLRIHQVVVDLRAQTMVQLDELDPRFDGFGPTLDEDFVRGDEIVKSDPGWIAAIARRGISDLATVRTVPLSAGVFGYADEIGHRVYRVLAFHQEHPSDLAWAHPIDGVVAHIDIDAGRVLRVIETPVVHVPPESGDYLDDAVRGPLRSGPLPIEIRQPDGVSFTVDDDVIEWQNWRLRIGYNGREGLTLHQVTFRDGDRVRDVLYRGSISEMVVNYGDPGPTHAWQNYFDVSEYQFGRLANALELGCDCLGEITYLDAVVADDHCAPRVLANAICIHEEDAGVLWKHRDDFAGSSVTRRQRRLVISFFVTVGNYDYGFYWYLGLDGTIRLECKATGIVFPSGDSGDRAHTTPLAPGLGAPVHQHMFCARLDVTIDGVRNAVDEVEVQRVPMGDGNRWGNAFTRRATRLHRESDGQRDAANHLGRTWRVSSSERINRTGEPTAYVLYPEGQPALLSADESSTRRRAAFAAHHLWVTRYQRDELWAAGYTVNQHPGGNGLPRYVAADRDIDGQDIVLWHSFGLTHFPRLEDWPIMPVDTAGFVLKPHGFFDRNPTLDLPETDLCATGHHDHHEHGHGHEHEHEHEHAHDGHHES
jgi:primary-amine oxidase